MLRLPQSQGVGITRSTGFTGVDAYGLLTGWVAPHWMSNDLLLRSSPGANLNDDAVFTPSARDQRPTWFLTSAGSASRTSSSRATRAVVGIAGFNASSCASTARCSSGAAPARGRSAASPRTAR